MNILYANSFFQKLFVSSKKTYALCDLFAMEAERLLVTITSFRQDDTSKSTAQTPKKIVFYQTQIYVVRDFSEPDTQAEQL